MSAIGVLPPTSPLLTHSNNVLEVGLVDGATFPVHVGEFPVLSSEEFLILNQGIPAPFRALSLKETTERSSLVMQPPEVQ